MHVHILGICGTFMGGLAAIAKSLGYKVTGSDLNVYPPMSTQLESLGISITQGYDTSQFDPIPDIIIIGNAMSRGNPAVEYILNQNLSYTSGPQWLLDNLLKDRWVLAVAGTHGKTSTSSMLAWIMQYAGLQPGFLIGGVPENFGVSARIGASPYFVIEADEYDSAFFDKRSKFVHYRPRTLLMNNLEFDHADIFDDLNAIKKQFHHVVRTVPSNGLILSPASDENLKDVLNMGCWSEQSHTGYTTKNRWQATQTSDDCSTFTVNYNDPSSNQTLESYIVEWPLIGKHNMDNALIAIAAAHHAGVKISEAVAALSQFKNVKRRMEIKGTVNSITVYDDFAHHPTAIATTLEGLRNKVGTQQIIAIIEPRSNTMRMGVHNNELARSWAQADAVHILENTTLNWDLQNIIDNSGVRVIPHENVDSIVKTVTAQANNNSHVLVMSNGGFDGIHQKLIDSLGDKYE